jgi:hypothetical protein
MPQKSFVTELANDTRRPIDIYELDGSVLVRLDPGQRFEVESVSPYTGYSRWSSVTWKDDGPHFVTRTNWTEPERGKWTITMLNQDGGAVERRLGTCLPKGIPVIVSVPLTSDLIMFRSLTIAKKRIMVKSDNGDGLLVHKWITGDERTPRPDSELKALAKIIDGLGKS